jgi:outer membrane protein insertion porin family
MPGLRVCTAFAACGLACAAACGAPAAPKRASTDTSAPTLEARPGRDIRWRGGTYRLVAIEVEGNDHAPAADLLAMMMLAHETAIDEAVLQRDELWIAAYYYDRGFVMAHVEPIVLTRAEFGDELRARVVVREGPRITLRKLDAYEVRANGTRAPLSVPWQKPAVEGQPYPRAVVAASLDALRDRYQDRGQAYVDVNVVDAIDVVGRTMTLDVAVSPGAYFTLGEIRVTGCRTVTGPSLAAELAIREGDLYSVRALMLALERLRGMPSIERAVVSTRRGRENTVDVHFEVDERPGLAPQIAGR